MTVTSVAGFLLARYAETEETLIRVASASGDEDVRSLGLFVMADIEAKRQAVAQLVTTMESDYAPWNQDILATLAKPYANHPDHRAVWELEPIETEPESETIEMETEEA